jgi:hypothetical protein
LGLFWTELVLLAIIVVGLASAGACTGSSGESFEFRPGVLVDSDAATCYLMNISGGIDALDLYSGEVLWTATTAQKPLLLLGGTLIAQAEPGERGNVLRLVLLDAGGNGTEESRVDIDLPDGVQAVINDGVGRVFRTEAWPAPNGLVVGWSYAEAPARGADRRSQDKTQVLRVEGAVQLNVETGAVTALAQVERPGPTPLPAELARLDEAGRLARPLWRSGDVYAAARRVTRDGTERTVLKRWQATTADSLPDVTLFTEDHTIRYPSADNTHLLASRRDRASTTKASYDWVVFSLATGARAGELRMDFPAAWFFVTGNLLVHEVQYQAHLLDGAWTEEPRQVRAIALETGEELWAHPLRDIAYRGSLPPNTAGLQDSKVPPGSSEAPQPTEGEQEP